MSNETYQYENPPSSKELTEMAKRALAKQGYDTPEKRKEWFESHKPIAVLCRRVDK
jgi:hypothetical protein